MKRYPAVRLVKGLGRLRSDDFHSSAQKDLDRWIRALAADRKQSDDVRLAAASALCPWGPREDFASPRPFPGKSVGGLPEDALAVIRRDYESVRRVVARNEEEAVLASGHALLAQEVYDALLDLVEYEGKDEHLPAHLATGLLRMSERFGEWQPGWNTFGDALYRLEAAVLECGDRLAEELGEEKYERVVVRMRAAIAADR